MSSITRRVCAMSTVQVWTWTFLVHNQSLFQVELMLIDFVAILKSEIKQSIPIMASVMALLGMTFLYLTTFFCNG